MKELLKEMKDATRAELKRANRANPLFRSNHEGFGVIIEEMYEADLAGKKTKAVGARFVKAIFEDDDLNATVRAKRIRENALYAACEYIQVAAMAEKFVISSNKRKTTEDLADINEGFSQEHADYLARTCPEAYTEEIIIDAPSFLRDNEAVMDACRKLAEVIEKAEEDENVK